MPNPGLGEEVVKVTLNIFKRDLAILKERYPNWTSEVRSIIRLHLLVGRAYEKPQTLGDLDDQEG